MKVITHHATYRFEDGNVKRTSVERPRKGDGEWRKVEFLFPPRVGYRMVLATEGIGLRHSSAVVEIQE